MSLIRTSFFEEGVHEIRIARETSTALIRLELETGSRYFFNGARIEGAAGYPDQFVRRYPAFKLGEVGDTYLWNRSKKFSVIACDDVAGVDTSDLAVAAFLGVVND